MRVESGSFGSERQIQMHMQLGVRVGHMLMEYSVPTDGVFFSFTNLQTITPDGAQSSAICHEKGRRNDCLGSQYSGMRKEGVQFVICKNASQTRPIR